MAGATSNGARTPAPSDHMFCVSKYYFVPCSNTQGGQMAECKDKLQRKNNNLLFELMKTKQNFRSN
jgi:hypothetical protein